MPEWMTRPSKAMTIADATSTWPLKNTLRPCGKPRSGLSAYEKVCVALVKRM